MGCQLTAKKAFTAIFIWASRYFFNSTDIFLVQVLATPGSCLARTCNKSHALYSTAF